MASYTFTCRQTPEAKARQSKATRKAAQSSARHCTDDHPAEEVYVTGNFDDWSKSEKLEKSGTSHSKKVELPKADEKIFYKFVADGEWKHDPTAKTETDSDGNVNNVLDPSDLEISASTANINSVGPGASTAAMAGQQPIESSKHEAPPGAFPETPATETPSAGGGSEQVYGVAPLPATGGAGNPVHLKPGEKVPDSSSLTANTTESNVKLDKESYEKADAGAPQIPAVLSPTSEREAAGAQPIFAGVGPQTSNMVPESSMGMGKDTPAPIESQDTGPAISSAAPQSTTAALAGQQPIRSKEEQGRAAPEVVQESQKEANVDPEASDNARALGEKDEVESELHSKVPEEPSVDDKNKGNEDSGMSKGGIAGLAAAGVAGAGAAAAGTAYAMNDKVKESTGKDPVSALPESVQKSISGMNQEASANPSEVPSARPAAQPTASDAALPQQLHAGEDVKVPAEADRATTNNVPEPVTASQKEAHADPEAAANKTAVEEKNEFESELKSKVPESEATGQPAPTASAATTSTAPLASAEKTDSISPDAAAAKSTSGAPQLADPTAGVGAINLEGKEGSKELNAPAHAPAKTPAEKVNQLVGQAREEQSRDVSPMTQAAPVGQGKPEVTEGPVSSKAPAASGPAAASAGGMTQEKPEVTEGPVSSKAPAVSGPDAAGAGGMTQEKPVVTEGPASSKAPEVSGPGAAGAGGMTQEKPEVTEGPVSSKAPAASGPDAAGAGGMTQEKPVVTEGPASSKAPEVSKPAGESDKMTQEKPEATTGAASSAAPAEQKGEEGAAAAGAGKPVGTPRNPESANTTPQKRGSLIDRMRNSPADSQKSGASGTTEGGKEKKKGLFSRLKEKLK
ncbi:hypothetical protein D0865_08531 [Hortaea werneckii]|uniref:AMP-activated protein kinase glycogen-binding domain-containing protein n=1 Tax=Hortaea werneckii TaxID=91943 RepID=A0A3M7C6Q9_HORWE|nr:hypothetical protein D0865_08531 [Hortaea werneckii]